MLIKKTGNLTWKDLGVKDWIDADTLTGRNLFDNTTASLPSFEYTPYKPIPRLEDIFVVKNKDGKLLSNKEFSTVMEALSHADTFYEETIVDKL